jgi:hypothetical protein
VSAVFVSKRIDGKIIQSPNKKSESFLEETWKNLIFLDVQRQGNIASEDIIKLYHRGKMQGQYRQSKGKYKNGDKVINN